MNYRETTRLHDNLKILEISIDSLQKKKMNSLKTQSYVLDTILINFVVTLTVTENRLSW